MKVKDNNRLVQLLIIGAITVTLIITPNLNKDSLIIPKVIILFCLALFFSPILIRTIRDSLKNSFIKVLVALILIWFFYSFLIILNSESPIEQLLFGRTGRGLGFITFSSVVILTLAASVFIDINNLKPLILGLITAGLISCIYACIQYFGLDIFKWDSKTNGIIGTLGNPNSQSSFTAMILIPTLVYLWNSKHRWISLVLATPILVFTIYISQSTQGYIGSSAAILGFILIFLWYKKRLLFIPFALSSLLAGLVAIFGMLGHGPLSYYLYKISVQSRGDFWRSAFTTGNSHPLFGVGFDSFGDYSLKYRDQVAASHPFAEYTDSAHNYYLDYLATGGYFFLLLNILITSLVLGSFFIIQKNLKSFDKNIASLFCAWLVFQLQCIINTQSLTLLTWNALISGAVIGVAGSFSQKVLSTQVATRKLNVLNPISLFMLVIGLIFMFPYFNTDRQMIQAGNSGNGDLLIKAATSFPESVVKYSQASRALLESGLPAPSLSLARSAVAFNSNSVALWALILINPSAPLEERVKARDVILKLDPLNIEVKDFKIQ
jgi:O-antigen ligase